MARKFFDGSVKGSFRIKSLFVADYYKDEACVIFD